MNVSSHNDAYHGRTGDRRYLQCFRFGPVFDRIGSASICHVGGSLADPSLSCMYRLRDHRGSIKMGQHNRDASVMSKYFSPYPLGYRQSVYLEMLQRSEVMSVAYFGGQGRVLFDYLRSAEPRFENPNANALAIGETDPELSVTFR